MAGSARGASTPDGLLRAARAARALGQSRTANAIFREAAAAAPKDPILTPAVNAAWGQLFLDAHDPANATASFRAALALDAEWAPAHAGLARALADENPPAAAAAARRAVEIDPALVDAHLFLAEAAIDADKPADARESLARALAANAQSPNAHALEAAIAYVDDRMADYESAVAKAVATNPGYGNAYRIVAAHAARSYRYDDAVTLVRKAIAIEPDNIRAQADLGLHLLRVGDERGARRALEAAFRADPYDIVTFNLLQMLDTLDGFSSLEASGVTVRLHPDEAPVLREYALPLARDAMTKRVIRAMENPYANVLAHPTGRLIGIRDAFEIDMQEVIRAAARTGTAIEINAHPARLDLDAANSRAAAAAGVMISIGTDTHVLSELDYMLYGIGTARRGWLTKANILNARPVRELLSLLRKKR